MPKRTVCINANQLSPAEALAQLIAYVAYPDGINNSTRRRTADALSRGALIYRAEMEPKWAQTPQLIRPEILLLEEKEMLSLSKRATMIAMRRIFVANEIAGPHIDAMITGKLNRLSTGHAPTVENVIISILPKLGLSGESVSTVKSRIWSSSKPVAHVALAFMGWIKQTGIMKGERDSTKLLMSLFFDDNFDAMLTMAEFYRKKLSLVRQFRISESETIRFVTSSAWV